jgi:hypothetical protein
MAVFQDIVLYSLDKSDKFLEVLTTSIICVSYYPDNEGSKHVWNVGKFLVRLLGAISQKNVILRYFIC